MEREVRRNKDRKNYKNRKNLKKKYLKNTRRDNIKENYQCNADNSSEHSFYENQPCAEMNESTNVFDQGLSQLPGRMAYNWSQSKFVEV